MNLQKVIIDEILDEAIMDLDELYDEFDVSKKDRNSNLSYEYRDGRCDAIDRAMTKISQLKDKLTEK
jgi:hypothetical protein